MDIFIRPAHTGDSKSIAALSDQLGYASDDLQIAIRLERILSNDEHVVFVATQDGEVVGWIHGFIALRIESDSFVEIGGLVVDQSVRKNGIGKILVEHIADWSASKECHILRVRCNSIRTDTHRFYENIGFNLNKEQKIFNRYLL